jgi:N-acetylmuramoyl-L-alanine amidase
VTITDLPSPNFNDRKAPTRFVVLHYTGMETGQAAIDRLRDPDAGVSAHYVVEEDGNVLRLVDEDRRAWHAGVGEWQGETDMNSASIGIEIVNGGHDFGLPDYPDAQIDAVISLVKDILLRRELTPAAVIGHSDLAPGRKQDPGEKFPWRRLADAGGAIWPSLIDAESDDVESDLAKIGYGVSAGLPAVIEAFQRRFRPSAVSGDADDETRRLIKAVAAMSGH